MAKFIIQLGVGQWVQLPEYMRRRIAELFKLKRSGGAEVFNGRLVTDGYTYKDLEGISVVKMQELLNLTETEYFTLFDSLLEHVENEHSGKIKQTEEEKEKKAEEVQAAAAKSAMETITAFAEAAKPILKKKKK